MCTKLTLRLAGIRCRLAVALLSAFVAAVSIGAIAPSAALAKYQDRFLEQVFPKNLTSTVYADPCHTKAPYVEWMECESTAAAPQYHNWVEGTVTNTYTRVGYVSVWAEATNGDLEKYANALGGKGTYAYSNKLPGKLSFPILGVMAWIAEGPAAYEWEPLRGKFDN